MVAHLSIISNFERKIYLRKHYKTIGLERGNYLNTVRNLRNVVRNVVF